MRMGRLLSSLSPWILFISSCSAPPADDGSPTPAVCNPDEPGRSSVSITVSDNDGALLPGATVSFSVDGGDFKAATCADDSALESCSKFNAGFELAGAFVVRTEKTGYESAEQSVTVDMTADGCHVQTQALSFSLSSVVAQCSGDPQPSVILAIASEGGKPLSGATVSYRVNGGEEQQATCADGSAPESCTSFTAGQELTGTFAIKAELAEYQPAELEVVVGSNPDGCHVATQEVQLALLEAPCQGEPQPSVQINVMDDVTWKNLPGATVTYSVDGGPFLTAECAIDVPSEECAAFVAGSDVAGVFVLRASAPGYTEVEKTMSISLDDEACHAESQFTELRLVPLAQAPSARVKVKDAEGAALAGATVTFSANGGEFRPADCADELPVEACTDFVAGWNLFGDFIIRAEKPGFSPLEVATTVGMDEDSCEPITADVEFTLSSAP